MKNAARAEELRAEASIGRPYGESRFIQRRAEALFGAKRISTGNGIRNKCGFFRRKEQFASAMLTFLGKQVSPYLLTDMPGTIGDHFIWAGTRALLGMGGIRYGEIAFGEIPGKQKIKGTLIIPGSGAFDQLWHEWLPELVLNSASIFDKVVILPSSYDLRVPIVVQCLQCPNVFPFARERKSYEAIKIFGRAALLFDLAVYYGFNCPNGRDAPRVPGRVLVALREDKGSLLPERGLAPNPSKSTDISGTKMDLAAWLASIYCVDTVVTDRLHVAVAAVLSGKELFYLDPYDGKITEYFSFTFRNAFQERIKRIDYDWLLDRGYVFRSGQLQRAAK